MNGSKLHLVRAVFGGLALGLGLALLLIVYKVIAFGTKTPFVVIVACVVLRLVLAVGLGRARRPATG